MHCHIKSMKCQIENRSPGILFCVTPKDNSTTHNHLFSITFASFGWHNTVLDGNMAKKNETKTTTIVIQTTKPKLTNIKNYRLNEPIADK